jgi:hypothetical protein
MIKKQQKWIALFVALTFMWLMQVSTMPAAAAGTSGQVSSAGVEQGPDYYEAVSHKAAPAKKKSPLPFILIGAGLLTVTAVVLFLVVLKGYNIVGSWEFSFVSTNYSYSYSWGMTFYGDKKIGTFMDSDGFGGIYSVDGKSITNISYDGLSLTLRGSFDSKDKTSGTYTWGSEVGTWTGIRSGSSAAMPRSPSTGKEKKNQEKISR